MANPIILKDKLAYFLITGASRGIGKTMAIETSKLFKAGSVVVLLARSLAGLEATKSAILASNPPLKVIVKSIDLSRPTPQQCDEILAESLPDQSTFDIALIVHNAGTIGDVTKWSKDLDSYADLQSYFDMNVFGPTVLNNRCLAALPVDSKKLIVNVTSKAAIAPFPSYTYYCMGKAAREMYFRCLAEEFPGLLVLNYAPGPVETDMIVEAQTKSVSVDLTKMVVDLRNQGHLLTTEMTTKRFLEVLEKGNFQSGGHVDYYDEI